MSIAPEAFGLLQCGETGAKVDVKYLISQYKGWNGFYALLFGFVDTSLVLAQVDYLDIVFVGIKSLSHVLFCADTDRTACMIEDSV